MTIPVDPPLGETLSSQRGFDGAWIHVRVDRVQLPSGRVATREVVEHPGAVAIVAITRDGNVLLLRQAHHPIQRVLLGLPAGTLEPGESPEACARRELMEETGYAAGNVTQIASYFTSPGYTSEQLTIFLAEECEGAAGSIDPDELITVVSTPVSEIPAMVTPGPAQVQDAKTLIGLLLLCQLRGLR
ncbi:MAG: NUDIX hydrolase [Chloroflexia bacterium]|nr:NUDIX hydrolase [Chloroflexia bacterium]